MTLITNNMKKIIITFEGVDEATALDRVSNVIQSGRVSWNKHGRHFCWLTTWGDGITVHTKAKRKGQKSDSFHVYKK